MTRSSWRPWLSRLFAATVGGYALASAWVLLWGGVGAGGAGAILAGVQTSFVVLALAVIWAFSPVRLLRVWLMLLGLTAGMLVLAFVLKHWGG